MMTYQEAIGELMSILNVSYEEAERVAYAVKSAIHNAPPSKRY